MERGKRGRPKGTKKTPNDLHERVFVAVEIARWNGRDYESGRLLSVCKGCLAVERQGGIASLLGGNIDEVRRRLLAQTNAKGVPFIIEKKIVQLLDRIEFINGAGGIFVQHHIQAATTIRARYNEAKRTVRRDPRLARFWENRVRQATGRRPLPDVHPRTVRVSGPPLLIDWVDPEKSKAS